MIVIFLDYFSIRRKVIKCLQSGIQTLNGFIKLAFKSNERSNVSDLSPTFNPDQREAHLQVISNEQCARRFGTFIIHSTLCTSAPRGVNICQGDSGGPLVAGSGTNRILVIILTQTTLKHQEVV